jgi:hypothetical protein
MGRKKQSIPPLDIEFIRECFAVRQDGTLVRRECHVAALAHEPATFRGPGNRLMVASMSTGRARDGDERNLRPENLILIERGPRPFTNSQVRRASSRHTTPTPAAISLGRIALPQLARRCDRLAEIGPGQSV